MAHLVLLHSQPGSDLTPDQQESVDIADQIAQELGQLGHRITMLPFNLDLGATMAALRQAAPDVVFNLVDDVDADDSLHMLAAQILQHMGLRFTGAHADVLFLTTHKLFTKRLLRANGLPTPDWISLDEAPAFEPGAAYILKPVNHDASIGIDEQAVVTPRTLEELRAHLRARQERTGWETFAERFVAGREFWVSFIEQAEGVRVFPPAEAIFTDYAPGQAPDYITYRAKWAKESFEYHHLKATFDFTAQEAPLIASLDELTRATWRALHLRAYGRIDFRVDRQGRPWILDVNINPYLPYHAGGLLDSAQQIGWDFQRLLAEVIGPLS